MPNVPDLVKSAGAFTLAGDVIESGGGGPIAAMVLRSQDLPASDKAVRGDIFHRPAHDRAGALEKA